MKTSLLPTWSLAGARVLVRADLNVPRSDDGAILDDFRAQALLPTLTTIFKNGGTVTLLAHSGRPHNKDAQLSLKPFIEWFKNQGFSTEFAENLLQARKLTIKKTVQIILVENLRFFPQENACDLAFAKELAQLGTYFIQDAFGALHRESASLSVVHTLFPATHKTIGLLTQKELQLMHLLIENPQKPFVLIVGGSKVATKLPLIHTLLDHVSTILLCPAIAFTFLKSQGLPVGKSLVDDNYLTQALAIMQEAKERKIELVTPIDYVVTKGTTKKPHPISITRNIGKNQMGISIGPETLKLFKEHIASARTLFFNGAPGFAHHPETLEGTRGIFQALQQNHGTKIIGGGDTVALARYFKCRHETGLFSTGGGVILAYLSRRNLPGLW